MTKLQKLQIKQSEIREKLAALSENDKRTDEQTAEMRSLTSDLTSLEPELRAAVVLQSTDDSATEKLFANDGENRELLELRNRSNLGNIFAATIEHRVTDGAELELQQHFGLQSNQIPLALLEKRAVTPAPANVGVNQMEIIPAIFPQSCAAFLGISMDTVGVGEVVYPVLVSSAVVGVPAKGAIPTGTGIDSEGSTTGGFSAEILSPASLRASFFYNREDRASFANMAEALRMNLSDALADKLDQQILNGDEGLFNGTVLDNHNVSAQTTYALYRSQLAYARVDGQYASTTGDLRMVMGSGTYAHAAAQYRGNNDNMDALMSLTSATGGVKVSTHVPAVASSKQNVVIALGMARHYVAAIWEGVTLVPDEITKASSGQIVITANMLHAVKLIRASGFYKQQTQHA